jgi:hypothetical protein
LCEPCFFVRPPSFNFAAQAINFLLNRNYRALLESLFGISGVGEPRQKVRVLGSDFLAVLRVGVDATENSWA